MKKNKILPVTLASLLLILVSIPVLRYHVTFRKDNVAKETVLLVHSGDSYEDLCEQILSSDLLKNRKSFLRAARKREFSRHFEPGRYVLKEGFSNQQIIRTIANNWETPMKFTLRSHIRTLEGLASFLGRNFDADSAAFAAVLFDDSLRNAAGFKAETYLGMFIPDTYEVYWTTRPEDLLKRFQKEYSRFWEGNRTALSRKLKMTPEEVTTLASIVCSETNNAGEMPKIAGVYINRLKKRIPLQACPTVIYAHKDIEPGIRRVLKRHLKIQSPYNTYIHRGLPPGPITLPPVNAIDAVLNYQPSDYLYFCAKPEFDGTHNFAASYSEHLKNSRAYNRALQQHLNKKS